MKHLTVRASVRPTLLPILLMLVSRVVAAAPVHGNFADSIARPLHSHPDRADFVTVNRPEFFHRPLYCVNSPCNLPGRGGNLRLGVQTS